MISVLYVDDEPDLLELARIFLEQSGGFRVRTSASAQEAVEAGQVQTCDVIVSDYQMPGMDGISFLQEVRRHYGSIPFILFTGRGREEVVIEAINNGADFYLQKGGDPAAQFAELATKIRYAVSRRNAERALAASEERYRSVVNDQPDLICRFLPDGTITFVNTAYRQYYAPLLDLENLPGKNIRDIMQVKNFAEVEKFLASLTQEHPIREMERTVTGRDGRMYWQLWSVRAIFGSGTAPAEFQVVGRDITDRKLMEAELRRKNDELNSSNEQIAANEEELRAQLDEIVTKQDALRRSEERFRAFTENIPDLTTIADLDGRYTYVSPSLLSFSGRKIGDIIGKESLGDRSPLGVHPEDVGRLRTSGRIAREHPGQPVSLSPFRAQDSAGREVWLDGTLTHLPDVEGIRGTLFHGRDITGSIRAMELLGEGEKRFRSLIETSPDMVWEIDPRGIFRYISPRVLSVMGYAPEDLVGRPITDLISEQGREHALRALEQHHTRPDPIPPIEVSALHRNGQPMTIEIRSTRITGADGSLQGFYGIACDVTERRHAEEALKKSEERFRSIIETSPDMIWEIDAQGTFRYVSPTVEDLLGYRPDELTGMSMMDLVADTAKRPEVIRGLARYLATTGPIPPMEVPARHRNGSDRIFEVRPSRVLDTDGRLLGYYGVARDITGMVQAREALKQSEALFRTIFESSPYPTAINSIPDMKFLTVNKTFLESGGYSEEEVLGKTPLDLGLVPAAEAAKLVARYAVSGRLENVPLTLAGKDGRQIHALFSSIPIVFGPGRAILTMTVEVTQLKRAEEELLRKNAELNSVIIRLSDAEKELQQKYNELEQNGVVIRQNEMKLRALIENALDGIIIIDFSGTILFANRAAGLMVDLADYQSILGKRNVMEFVGFESRDDVMEDFRKVAGGTDSYVARYKLVTERKREIWVESIGKKIPYDNSAAIILSLRDVSEQKRAEEALSESRRMLAEAMDLADIVNWEYDITSGNFTFDDRFYAMYGTSAQREGGTLMPAETYTREFVHLEDRHMVAEEVEKALAATDTDYVSQVEHRIVRRDGAVRHIVVRIGLTKDSAGKTIRTHGANQDITDRKKAEDALRSANHQLNLLTGITRHDILNKVSVILGYIAMAEKYCTDPGQDAVLKKMRSATTAIQSQIEFTRVYQDLGTHEPQWLALDSLLPYSFVPVTIALNANLKGIQVYADPMLEKVFFNLLDNSVRHGGRVTEITVSARNVSGDLLVVWEDNGVGIPAAEKDLIFERGYGRHTGLGLFLVREVLALTGMTIAEAGEEGKGARFEVLVPKGTYRLDENRWLVRDS